MKSDIPLAIGFVKNIIRSIELKDDGALEMIRKQLIVRVYNKENKVKVAHSSLIPFINYNPITE
jgi:hypothetical protein